MKQIVIAIAGAAIGGALGYFGFHWMYSHGFCALVLPGGLLGLGGSFSRTRAIWPSVCFGLAAFALGVFTEWKYFPFKKDDSFTYFLLHLHTTDPAMLLMVVIGTGLGFWIPFRQVERSREVER